MKKYDHLREKALYLRKEKKLTLDEICDKLSLGKGTVYYWIKDIKIPRTNKQKLQVYKAAKSTYNKYKKLRDDAYKKGQDEAKEILKRRDIRDFVVLYMAEGSRSGRNDVGFCNTSLEMMAFVNSIVREIADKEIQYSIAIHKDHDIDSVKKEVAKSLGIDEKVITIIDKETCNLTTRNRRAPYGVIRIRVYDTYLKCRINAWMDYIREEWLKELGEKK